MIKKMAALMAVLMVLFSADSYYVKAQKHSLDSFKSTENVQADSFKPIESISVINTQETKFVNIKQSSSSKSKTLGIIYGSLTGINILKENGNYVYIEARDYKTDKLVKGYVLASQIKKVSPKKPYQIIVDLSDQKVYVYKYELLEKEMLCSTGIDGSETPVGTYIIGGRGNSFYSTYYKQGAYNWVRFNYNFLFHSVPFNVNRRIIPEEAEKLGQKASHGCVRLSIEDSKWFYKTIPAGTAVVIQE